MGKKHFPGFKLFRNGIYRNNRVDMPSEAVSNFSSEAIFVFRKKRKRVKIVNYFGEKNRWFKIKSDKGSIIILKLGPYFISQYFTIVLAIVYAKTLVHRLGFSYPKLTPKFTNQAFFLHFHW